MVLGAIPVRVEVQVTTRNMRYLVQNYIPIDQLFAYEQSL